MKKKLKIYVLLFAILICAIPQSTLAATKTKTHKVSYLFATSRGGMATAIIDAKIVEGYTKVGKNKLKYNNRSATMCYKIEATNVKPKILWTAQRYLNSKNKTLKTFKWTRKPLLVKPGYNYAGYFENKTAVTYPASNNNKSVMHYNVGNPEFVYQTRTGSISINLEH